MDTEIALKQLVEQPVGENGQEELFPGCDRSGDERADAPGELQHHTATDGQEQNTANGGGSKRHQITPG